MNTAIRAVIRTGLHKGWVGLDIHCVYAGLFVGDAQSMAPARWGKSFSREETYSEAPAALSSKLRKADRIDYLSVRVNCEFGTWT